MLSSALLATCSQLAEVEWRGSVWKQGRGGERLRLLCFDSLLMSLFTSVVSLSDYLLLSLGAAVSVSLKGQLGKAGSFSGPTPPALLPTGSPSLALQPSLSQSNGIFTQIHKATFLPRQD